MEPVQETTIKNDGRIRKGQRLSPCTEFKKGQHWRERKPHWDRLWLVQEYVLLGKSTGEIAQDIGTTDANVIYWLKKHEIPRRSISEARSLKYWGASGVDNPMFGRTGPDSVNWKGGITADRQAYYNSQEWKDASLAVWKRDKGQCQRCFQSYRIIKLNVHHIVSFKVVELRTEVSNLVLLCRPCHFWVHSKKNYEKIFIKGGAEYGGTS